MSGVHIVPQGAPEGPVVTASGPLPTIEARQGIVGSWAAAISASHSSPFYCWTSSRCYTWGICKSEVSVLSLDVTFLKPLAIYRWIPEQEGSIFLSGVYEIDLRMEPKTQEEEEQFEGLSHFVRQRFAKSNV